MKAIQLHKIASSTVKLRLEKLIELTSEGQSLPGHVVIVEALHEKSRYDQLELTTGRMAKISRGDIIAGVLGSRRALRGFCGDLPETIAIGDTLQILNLGGVIGRCTSEHLDLGHPHDVKLLGFGCRDGRPLNIRTTAIPTASTLEPSAPIVLVSGTCMNSGKTVAACTIVERLNQAGRKVAAAKLTGIACLRDTLAMEDHGAFKTLSFLDCGLPSTVDTDNPAGVAMAIVNELNRQAPDVIVIEMGDGIIGSYGVDAILDDRAFQEQVACHVMCANDLVAAWGALEQMKLRGLDIDIFAGPATDNEVGCEYVADVLGIRPANARTHSEQLGQTVQEQLG